MPTATNFWGTDAGCPNTGYSAAEAMPKTATCNGDGNGRIDTFNEAMRAWQQLANAGFIQGEYSGIPGSPNPSAPNPSFAPITIGIDEPASRISSCGWTVGYMPLNVNNGLTLTITPGTYLQISAGAGDLDYPPCLTPTEAYGIDTKIDDGLPNTGNVIDGGAELYRELIGNPGIWAADSSTMLEHSSKWRCEQTSTLKQYNISDSGIYCDPFFNTGL